jgi:hypothetical protein
MRLKNWDKGEVYCAFPRFCAEYNNRYILRHCTTIEFILQKKNHINPLTFIFLIE